MSICAFAQQKGAVISWEKTIHNFGIIKMEDGLQKYRFVFVNTGDEPLYLSRVKSGCGCTTADYTKEPIAPGAKGYVEVIFNPENRLGIFDKNITVVCNATSKPVSNLKINGIVIVSKVN